eukprot:m.10111 g.10111  ORF g.10111 m.10111 type:complete len:91 (+) comp7210_c0_seq2:166-438(+)
MEVLKRLATGFGAVGAIGLAGKLIMDYTSPTTEEFIKENPEFSEKIHSQERTNNKIHELLLNSAKSDLPAWQPKYEKSAKESAGLGEHKG